MIEINQDLIAANPWLANSESEILKILQDPDTKEISKSDFFKQDMRLFKKPNRYFCYQINIPSWDNWFIQIDKVNQSAYTMFRRELVLNKQYVHCHFTKILVSNAQIVHCTSDHLLDQQLAKFLLQLPKNHQNSRLIEEAQNYQML